MIRNVLILLVSIVVYLSFGITNFLFILFSILTTYIAAKFLEKRSKKIILTIAIGINAFILIFFKLYGANLFPSLEENWNLVAPMGVSKMLGIELQENFDSPYYAQTIKEFWRRWHISLSSWLRDYIYIPLGGSRCSKIRKVVNTLITFLVSGFWHGANYLLWGILHGIFVLLGDTLKTKWKWLNRGITFVLVSFLWSFFIWSNTGEAVRMMGSVFTTWNIVDLGNNILNLGLTFADWVVLLVFTLVLFVFDGNKSKIIQKVKKWSPEVKTIILCSILLCIFILGIYGIGFQVDDFIYSKF